MFDGAVCIVALLDVFGGRLMGLYWCSWVEGRYDWSLSCELGELEYCVSLKASPWLSVL